MLSYRLVKRHRFSFSSVKIASDFRSVSFRVDSMGLNWIVWLNTTKLLKCNKRFVWCPAHVINSKGIITFQCLIPSLKSVPGLCLGLSAGTGRIRWVITLGVFALSQFLFILGKNHQVLTKNLDGLIKNHPTSVQLVTPRSSIHLNIKSIYSHRLELQAPNCSF